MISLFLFLITISSFLFYGVVGQDKTWLLGPVYLFSYIAITIALLKRALGFRRSAMGSEIRNQRSKARGQRSASGPEGPTPRREDRGQSSVFRLPSSGLLWIIFVIYGVCLISKAAVPFESKLVALFIGSVVGAYLVWGAELTAFKDNRVVLGWLIFVVMLLALYGLVIHFKSPTSILWTERYTDAYEGRLRSTYICPNHFAHLMQMMMPFCLALIFIPQSGLYLKVLSAYSFVVFLPPMFLTESRAGWLGSIAAAGVLLCLMALRRSKKLFVLLVLLVPLCSFLILLAGWQYSETFQRRAKPVVEFLQHQSEEGIGSEARDFRPQTWMDTIDMIQDSPLLGHGPGNYRYTFPEYRNRFKGHRIVTGHPHNEYLELIADYGLIGFGLFAMAWIYGCVWVLVKSLKAEESRHAFMGFAFVGAAAGTMVHSFFDFQMHVYPNALVFALLAAVAVGPLRVAQRRQKSEGRRQKGRGKAALECGDSSPLSPARDSFSRERAQRSEAREQRTEVAPRDGGFARSDVSSQQSAISNQHSDDNPKPKANSQMPARFLASLLAVGYLLLAIICLQIMSSAYIRAMADKAVGTQSPALGTMHPAVKLYNLAVRIDPQNWRAYKGMGNLLYAQRYHCLDRDEKIQLAEQERVWFEKAYVHNPKDPEVVSAYGKCLIFLSRVQGGNQTSDVRGQISEGGGQQAEDRGQPSAVSEQLTQDQQTLNNQQPATSNSLIEQGLDLLREACRYRKFNDNYWWMLGAELRKAGQYEEALEAFLAMEKVKRTPSSRKNIQWLEKRMSQIGSQTSGEEKQTSDDRSQMSNLQLKPEKTSLTELLNLME